MTQKQEDGDIKNLFDQFYKDRNGTIDMTEISKVLDLYFEGKKAAEWKARIDARLGDKIKNGIKYHDFCSLIKQFASEEKAKKSQQLKDFFSKMDKDKDGLITKMELKKGLENLTKSGMEDAIFDELFSTFGNDKYIIDFEGFCVMHDKLIDM